MSIDEAAPFLGNQENVDAPDLTRTEPKRERSTVKFPYTDIDDAVVIARTIKRLHGQRCDLDQLATALGGASTTSGSFRTKVATASTFGAITSSRGAVELTDLGHRLADDETRDVALVDAFQTVPLYRAIYDRYRARSLPGDAGLESEMRELGVVASQTERARQVFQRSASKAGLFWGGPTRLVLPPFARGDREVQPDPVDPSTEAPVAAPGGASVLTNPLLAALMQRMLPPENESFTARERRRFFRALAVNLDVVYGEPDDGELDPDMLANLFRLTPAVDRSVNRPSTSEH